MKKLSKISLQAIAFLCAVVYSNSANAQIDITFSDGDVSAAAFDLLIGTEQTISIFATESGANTELSGSGLVGFGIVGNSTATGSSAVITDLRINPSFTFPSGTNEFDDNSLNAGGITLGGPAVAGTSVLLADFDLSVADVGTTTFTFGDRTEGLDDFSTADNQGLDDIIFLGGRTFSLTVNGVDPSAIPEPSSAAILFALAVCGATSRRRS